MAQYLPLMQHCSRLTQDLILKWTSVNNTGNELFGEFNKVIKETEWWQLLKSVYPSYSKQLSLEEHMQWVPIAY